MGGTSSQEWSRRGWFCTLVVSAGIASWVVSCGDDGQQPIPDTGVEVHDLTEDGDGLVEIPAHGRATPPRITIIHEPVETWEQVAMVRRFQPDIVVRGWFKWYNAPNYDDLAWAVEKLHEFDTLFQGGVTVAALGRIRGGACENGLDETTFLDYITRDPYGDPLVVSTYGSEVIDYYHIALNNPEAREYVMRWVRDEIDAGADGIWFDEIQGVFPWLNEGYDDYAITAFAQFLYQKYVVGQGWAEDDSRFETELEIPPFLLGSSIRSFDYRAWLAWKMDESGVPYASDPEQGVPWQEPWDSPNPLHREWGHAWGTDPRLHDTFQWNAARTFWEQFVTETREYAREQYDRELIITCNENGAPQPFVDFQQIHNFELPMVGTGDGRLDSTYTGNLTWLEQRVALSEAVAPGKPVVQFVDWPGETDRLVPLSIPDTRAFLYTYIPEAYAAGALFAVPVRGSSYHADDEGVLEETAALVDHLRRYDPLLFDRSRPASLDVRTDDPAVSVRVREVPDRTVVHLIDHRPVLETSVTRPLTVHLPSTSEYVWTVAPHAPFELRLTVEEDGDVVLPEFHYSALLVLEQQAPENLGHIIASDGRPVGGARVTHLAGGRSALSGMDGSYAFPGAGAGRLSVHAEGFLPEPDWRHDSRLQVSPYEPVRFRITDDLGLPAVGVEAHLRWVGGEARGVTDVLGEISASVPPDTMVEVESAYPLTNAGRRVLRK